MKTPVVRKRRCAIYTRKSSEEGLDQEFNSLDAQREACEAYVASQKAEGWILVPDRYDDGGFSGSTLERPALTRLFDIAREMEAHSLSKNLQSFDALGVEVKSFLGILLDFSSLPREKIAAAVHSKAIKSAKSPEASSTGPGPLFDGEGPASSRGS